VAGNRSYNFALADGCGSPAIRPQYMQIEQSPFRRAADEAALSFFSLRMVVDDATIRYLNT
jgi:hypothetical protein